MIKSVRVGLFFSFVYVFSPLYAQNRNSIEGFHKLYPKECAVLITDNALYQNGESILYKVFLWDGNEHLEQKESNVAQIVLRDATGSVVHGQNIMIVGGEGNGSLELDSAKSGFYSLEVYTKWMSNFTQLPIARKSLWVTQYEQMPQGKFSRGIVKPEGGNLRVGGKQRIAVSPGIFSPSGFSIKIKNQFQEIIFTDSIYSFFGVVQPNLTMPGSYLFELCLLDSKLCSQQKISTSKSPSLMLEEINGDTINFRIDGQDSATSAINFVILNQHALLKNIAVTGRVISIDRQELPSGILHAMLVEEKKILSHRAFYNSKDEEIEIDLKLFSDTVTSVQIKSGDLPSTIFVSPTQVVVGANFIEDASFGVLEMDSLMLFEQYALQEAFEEYLAKGKLPTDYFRSTSYFDKRNVFPEKSDAFATPLNLVLSGFKNADGVKNAIREKAIYSRIVETYNFEFETTLTPLPTDRIYNILDYPDVKTMGDVFDYSVIHNLIRRKVGDRMEFAFTYINRKGVKSIYSGKPVVCLDGHIIQDIDMLRGVSTGNIVSVETLYSPRRIIDSGLKELFPFGMINFRSEPNTLNKELLAQYPTLFPGAITWPKVFKFENDSKRIPSFVSVCNWIPNYRSEQRISLPKVAEIKYTLFFLNIELAKFGKSVIKEFP